MCNIKPIFSSAIVTKTNRLADIQAERFGSVISDIGLLH
jgi:hypothetical protein